MRVVRNRLKLYKIIILYKITNTVTRYVSSGQYT